MSHGYHQSVNSFRENGKHLKSSQKYLPTIMYRFEHINQDIPLQFFYFKIFTSPFYVSDTISNIFHLSVTVKIFFFT